MEGFGDVLDVQITPFFNKRIQTANQQIQNPNSSPVTSHKNDLLEELQPQSITISVKSTRPLVAVMPLWTGLQRLMNS